MNAHDFALFALASLMLNITPGADMLYIISRSTTQGVKAGMISALGITTGCLVHITAAVFGLSLIIMKSVIAFAIIKYVGAVYIIYLGIKSLISHSTYFVNSDISKDGHVKIFTQGAFINMLNPKVALFFLAFLPQFLSVNTPHLGFQTLLLGLWFNFSGLLVNLLVAVLFGKSGNYLNRFPGFRFFMEKITGSILIYIGCRIAFMKKS